MYRQSLRRLELLLRESMIASDHLNAIGSNANSPTDLQAKMIQAAVSKRDQMEEIAKLIGSIITPIISNMASNTDKLINLQFFSINLFNPAKGIFVDAGLAAMIHNALTDYYASINDKQNLMISRYWMGRVYRHYSATESEYAVYQSAINELEGLDSFDRYDARDYTVRLLCNCVAAMYDLGDLDGCLTFSHKMLKFFDEKEQIPGFLSEADWIASKYTMYTNMTIALLDILHKDSGNKIAIEQALEYQSKAIGCEESLIGTEKCLSVARIISLETQMIAGILLEDEYYALLNDMLNNLNTYETFEAKEEIQLNIFERLLRKLLYSSEDADAHKIRLGRDLFDVVFSLCSRSRRSNEEAGIVTYLMSYVSLCEGILDCKGIVSSMLKMARMLYPYTYLHSISVARLAVAITQKLILSNPSLFDELRWAINDGKTPAEDSEIINFINLAALSHDAGKIGITSSVSQTTRRITDFEFNVIKQHPMIGYKLLGSTNTTQKLSYIALCHHRSFDNTGGYPNNIPDDYKPYILATSIISIADAIEAGTDFASRWYNHRKTLDDLIVELRKGSGTRYHGDVVSIIEDKELYNELSNILTSKRQLAFFEVAKGQDLELFENDQQR